ncbi:hypothetical protein [Aurantiacibacter gangjinensis]|uniref:hypothetical protein n=1 Tax=Aurantiacibacter gangjinensis TaxID=502682 RepID=UPI00069A3D62|nr:hypothetical protein [Aurantiacibacter gangjinensis]APE29264.1 hypothetical protein BMF35_b0009 [Aurantiacibacter gangjinensis]
MTDMTTAPARRLTGWRIAGWGSLAAILAIPALAMQFTEEVAWSAGDFFVAACLLALLGIGVELAVRMTGSMLSRLAMALLVAVAVFTIWATLAVGIVGSERQAINLAFLAIAGGGVIAAIAMRRRLASIATLGAAAVLLTGLVAELTGTPDWGPVLFVAVLWCVPAVLAKLARPR